MTEQTFNPEETIYRYRELEALLNLELLNRPDWQERRANDDMSFLLESKYFQEQEKLKKIAQANDYEINGYDDDNDNTTIYIIEKIEQNIPFGTPRGDK